MRPSPTSILIILSLTLGACEGPNGAVYIPPESISGQICAARCSEAHNDCRKDCVLQQRECHNRIQGEALTQYENYMSQQFLHDDAIKYHESDFENLEPCDSGFRACSTACEAPYQACYTKCGGEVKQEGKVDISLPLTRP